MTYFLGWFPGDDFHLCGTTVWVRHKETADKDLFYYLEIDHQNNTSLCSLYIQFQMNPIPNLHVFGLWEKTGVKNQHISTQEDRGSTQARQQTVLMNNHKISHPFLSNI